MQHVMLLLLRKALADALQNNVVLRIISLDSNNLGLEGAKARMSLTAFLFHVYCTHVPHLHMLRLPLLLCINCTFMLSSSPKK